MHDDVPLVVAEVNPDAAERHSGLVANPNCSTMQMVVALAPIQRAVGIERIVVSTYQSVSGTGQRAIDELRDQAHALLHEQEPPPAEVYPHRIAFNVAAPGRDLQGRRRLHDRGAQDDGRDAQDPRRSARTSSGSRRPASGCPCSSATRESVNVADARAARRPRSAASCSPARAGVVVVDAPGEGVYPLASDAAGPRRGARRPDPPRPLARALPQPLDRRRQPPQGRGDQRGPGRRAARTSAT